MFQYPRFEEAQSVLPTLREAIQQRDVAPQKVVHAIYVVEGFGLSMYPGQPTEGLDALREPMTDEQALGALDRLEATAEEQRAGRGAISIPWQAFLAYLFQLLQQWLPKVTP